MSHPMRRSTDRARFWFAPKENVYRDVWLILISLVCAAAILKAIPASNNASRAVRTLAEQRHATILQTCREQNHKHDETIRRLLVLAARPDPAVSRSQRQTNVRATIFLINAFEPHQDCQQLVQREAPLKSAPHT